MQIFLFICEPEPFPGSRHDTRAALLQPCAVIGHSVWRHQWVEMKWVELLVMHPEAPYLIPYKIKTSEILDAYY